MYEFSSVGVFFVYFCDFFKELGGDRGASSSGCSNVLKNKEPHSEISEAISLTHTVKRTPGPIQHTAWSHYGEQCVLTQ